jgi:predicted small lipoprotein YifL
MHQISSHAQRASWLLGIFCTFILVSACGLKGPLYLPDQKPSAASPSAPQSSSPTTHTPSAQKKQKQGQQPNTTAPDAPVAQPDPAQSPTSPPTP